MIRISKSEMIAVVTTVALFLPAVARAQIAYPKRPIDTSTLEKMRGGTVDVGAKPSPQHEALLKELAIWLAHRLVQPPFNGMDADAKGIDSIETLMNELDKRWCTWPNRGQPNEVQLNYAKAFGRALESEVMYVYDNSDKRLDKINAARMLSLIGLLPYEGIADQYLKMIREDAFPPEIKLFAFQGLRNLLAIPDPLTPGKHFIRSNARLKDISDELEKFITKKHPATLSSDEGRVVQYIRREAVRALAQMKHSVIRQGGNVLAKPIMTLLRVATNDKYVKPADVAMPSMGFHILEQIEAVIGICSMLPERNMNIDVVAYMVNDALVDIAAYQAKERTDFGKDNRNKPLVPWRITAIRLIDALKQWKANMAGIPANRSPNFAVDLSDLATSPLCLPKLESTLDAVTAQPDYRAFDNWKRTPARKPKSNLVFVEDDTSAVEIK